MRNHTRSTPLGGELHRRRIIEGTLVGLGGLAAGTLVPEVALAAPATPRSGTKITKNPIKPKIPTSEIRVELVPFATPQPTAAAPPRALLNYLYHDGNGRLFVADSRGPIWQIDRSTGTTSLFLDLAIARGGALITSRPGKVNTVGVRSFAFHPNFANAGRPGFRAFYTATVERVAGTTLPCGKFPVVHHSVVAEWTTDASGQPIPSSRRELLRTAHWQEAHNLDTIIFDPHSGHLLLTVGDGGNRGSSPDPYNAGQNRKVALGKVLCIDPLASGAKPYSVPGDNPFVGKSGYLPEIWAYGLRHPQSLSFDRGGDGAGLLIDIGQARVEEVNYLIKGANYGWSLCEGTFVTDRANLKILYGLPSDDAKYKLTYPVVQYDHDEGQAIVGGYVYRGSTVAALAGHYIFGDTVRGRIFHVSLASLVHGKQATPKELRLAKGGQDVTLLGLVGGANGRVDLRFGQDESGEVYVMTKQEGVIYTMRPA